VVVAVGAVGVMEVVPHQVVGVGAVRHRLVPAARTVDVGGVMGAAGVGRGAFLGVGAADGDDVLVDVVAVAVVQVPVVEVVDVAAVPDGGMAAALPVNVGMALVDRVGPVFHLRLFRLYNCY
jgi:hypothetical protein